MPMNDEPIPERRSFTHLDEIRGKLDRIELTTNNVHTSQKIMESSFGNHEHQNERDFKAIALELARSEDTLREKHFEMVAEFKLIKSDVEKIKVQIARWGGALALLIPIVTWSANHLFMK